MELKNDVDKFELQELERDIQIIETHWLNVYELLIAAFAMVAARDDGVSSEESSIGGNQEFMIDVEFGVS